MNFIIFLYSIIYFIMLYFIILFYSVAYCYFNNNGLPTQWILTLKCFMCTSKITCFENVSLKFSLHYKAVLFLINLCYPVVYVWMYVCVLPPCGLQTLVRWLQEWDIKILQKSTVVEEVGNHLFSVLLAFLLVTSFIMYTSNLYQSIMWLYRPTDCFFVTSFNYNNTL